MKKFTIQNNIGEALKDFPICNYFVNTYDKCKKRTSLSWLEVVDDNNFVILNDYAKMLVQEPIEGEKATIYPDDSIEAFAMLDFTALSLMLIEFEGNEECSKELLNDSNVRLIEDASIALSILITFDAMRRSGTATIKGNGKITDFRGKNGTKIVLTELGIAYNDSIATMRNIADMMDSREE